MRQKHSAYLSRPCMDVDAEDRNYRRQVQQSSEELRRAIVRYQQRGATFTICR